MAVIRYLEVTFGDNDFGRPVIDALTRLWKWMHESNGHHGKPMGELFKKLHNEGILLKMVNRLVDSEYIAQDVEFATRGVHNMEEWPESHRHKIPTTLRSIATPYLSLELRLHSNKRFTKEWKNGEHAWLNLQTGAAATF